ncbi:MAG: hypothetical protein CSA66_01965 [Proteobacteria bacterium]|nr:MAG: hypothetical protein CSA66_01965 [Pseudomonadota bacterium]
MSNNSLRRCVSAAAAATALLLTLAAAPSGRAQAREDFAPADTLGMGDNVRALVWGPSALYFNPAGLSRGRALIAQAGYGYFDGRDGHAFTAAVVDAATNPHVAMGAGYGYISSAVGGVDRDGHQFRSGISTGYVTGDVGLYAGVGARYLGLTIGADDDDTGETNDVDAWTFDAGLLLDLANRIKFAVVGANLLDAKTGEAARKLGLGLAFNFQTLEVTGDMELDLADRSEDTILRYGFGAQYGFGESFHARIGVVFDQPRDEERLSGGLGFATLEWALDVGYSSAVSDPTNVAAVATFRYMPRISGGR